jgi:hypothetical protein
MVYIYIYIVSDSSVGGFSWKLEIEFRVLIGWCAETSIDMLLGLNLAK